MAGSQTANDKINGDPPDTGGTIGTRMPQPIGVPYEVWDPQTETWVPFKASRPSSTPQTPDTSGMTAQQRALANEFAPGSFGTSQTGVQPVQVPPRYYDGAEFAPSGWDPARIADIQRRMIAVGLIPKTANVHIGVWDATSQAGFRDLLGFANSTGADYLEALGNYAASKGTNPSGRGPLVTQPSNPDDLRQVFRKAIIDELGEGWDQARIDRLVSSYQADEVATQTAAYNAVDTGGTVAPTPSPQAYAVAQARAQDPSGAQAHDALGYQTEFFNALGGVV